MAIVDNNAVEEIITKKEHIFMQDMSIAQERTLTENDPPQVITAKNTFN